MKERLKKDQKKVDLKYTFKVLWNFLEPYKFGIGGIILLMLGNELVSFFDNFFFKYLVDKATIFVVGESNVAVFAKIVLMAVLVYIGVKIIGAVLWLFTMRMINKLEANLMCDIEKKSFWHVLNLSYRYHTEKKTGSLISQFSRGVGRVESFTDALVFNFIPTLFQLALSVGIIFMFDVKTSIALLIMSIIFILASIVMTHRQEQPQEEANTQEDLLKHNLSDIFTNVETVKYFAKERITFNHFSQLSELLKNARYKFWNLFSWFYALETFIFGLGLGAIFYLSFTSYLHGNLTLGSVTLIYSAVLGLIPHLVGLMHGYRSFVRSSVDMSDLFALYKLKNEVVDIPNAPELQVSKGEILFENVSFTYPKVRGPGRMKPKYFVDRFSLKIEENQKVAIVGPSGSGKTTITKLLYRLFDINSGAIYVDGQNISKVKQQSLRENLSIVPQEPILFDNSLYFNIAYANPKAKRKEVWNTIYSAKLDSLVGRLPDKEKTVIGERGVKLSGGERQRVSIARALLDNRKILIMDEATSALDSNTEKQIQAELEELMRNRTCIIIAHRLSTIMNADVIVVMDKGRIVEMGKHEQLIHVRGGLYRKLWEIQQGKK